MKMLLKQPQDTYFIYLGVGGFFFGGGSVCFLFGWFFYCCLFDLKDKKIGIGTLKCVWVVFSQHPQERAPLRSQLGLRAISWLLSWGWRPQIWCNCVTVHVFPSWLMQTQHQQQLRVLQGHGWAQSLPSAFLRHSQGSFIPWSTPPFFLPPRINAESVEELYILD